MKKYAKYYVVAIIFMILATFCGCSSQSSSDNSNSQSSTNKGELLEGYPEDIMPLYKMVKIDSCAYNVRSDPNYIIGKDLYSVSYYSEASVEELNSYYRSLMTDIDEEYSSEDFIEGDINTQHTFVSLHEEEEDDTYVSISLGAKKEDYSDENPYFSDYPEGLIEKIKPATITEQNYQVQYSRYNDNVIIQYFKIYTTELTVDKAVKFYSDKYNGQEGFSLTEDNNASKLYWKAQGYECEIRISQGGKNEYRFVSTCIRKE